MPAGPNIGMSSTLSLLVNIDRRGFDKSRELIRSLQKDKLNLKLDDAALQRMAASIGGAISEGEKTLVMNLRNRLDEDVRRVGEAFTNERERLKRELRGRGVAEGSAEETALFKAQEDLLDQQLRVIEQEYAKRVESAKKLKEATSPRAMGQAGADMASGVIGALNNVKSGDLAGLTKALIGGLGSAAAKRSETLAGKAAVAGTSAEGAGLARAAMTMGAAAATLTVVAGALAGIVALFVAADSQAKELNKTMMEGASIADFAHKRQENGLIDVTSSMDAARKSALDLALKYRGTKEEFAGYLGMLNQAGFSYSEMAASAGRYRSEQQAISDVLETTFRWSTAMGLSFSEAAEAEAGWSSDFGSSLTDISDKFAAITGAAMAGGFNVKRFFTAVSQATAGMALYNVRMEEAAALLSKTSKILGGADASEFIRSLAQGFTDESMTDRMKRIMIAGAGDTQKIFEATAERTAKGFVKTFQGSKTQDAITAAFSEVGVNFGKGGVSFDKDTLARTWGQMDEKSRRLVIAQLREGKDEQSAAAARQLETLGRVVDGTTGGFDAQVRGLSALDMQGKLAFKLQTLGDKKLNDMSAVELAAFEQYAGISGAQLEQLMRVESQLLADYELAKARGQTEGKSFQEWVASNDEATAQIEAVKDIEDQSTYFARSTVENTRSLLSVMQNTIAIVLNDIYSLMLKMFPWMTDAKLTGESMKKQQGAIDEVRKMREMLVSTTEEIDKQLVGLDKTLSSTGAGSEEHQEAAAKKSALEEERAKKMAAVSLLRAQESGILQLGNDAIEGTSNPKELIALAAREMAKTGEHMQALESLSPEEIARVKEAATGGFMAGGGEHLQRAHAAMGDTGIGAARLGIGLANTFGADLMGPVEELNAGIDAGNAAIMSVLLSGESLSQEQLAEVERTAATDEEGLTLAQKVERARKRWQGSGKYLDTTVEAMTQALRKSEARKLAGQLGVSAEDMPGVVADILDGGEMGKALAAAVGSNPALRGSVVAAGISNDFISRPGQRAQRFSSADTLVGFKDGGPIAKMAGSGSTHITINVNGGDQSQVYQTVKSALKNSGLRP